MKTESKIICFIGPSRAGKTTQATMLSAQLRKLKIPHVKVYLKSFHGLVYLLLKFILFLTSNEVDSGFNPMVAIGLYNPNLKDRLPHRFLLLLDQLTFSLLDLLLVRMPCILGRMVIVEEYIPGRVNDYLSCPLPYREWSIVKILLKVNLALLPKDLFVVYLDCPYNVSKLRVTLTSSVLELPSYFENWRRVYRLIRNLQPSADFIYINTGSLTPEEVQDRLLQTMTNFIWSELTPDSHPLRARSY